MMSSPSWITVPLPPCGRDHRTARRSASRGAPREAGHHIWGIFNRRFWGESLRYRHTNGLVDTTRPRSSAKRRSWPEALQRQIVAETEEAGASVSVVARRHDVNANQVFQWRRELLPN